MSLFDDDEAPLEPAADEGGADEAQAEPEEPAEPEPEPVVDQRLLDAAIRFLSEAPQGEFEDCYSSMTQLVRDPNVPLVAKRRALPGWMKANCLPVDVDGKRALICADALLESGQFVDPNSYRPFTFNFERRQVTSIGDPLRSSSLRESLQPALQKWAGGALRNGSAGVYDAPDGATVVISGTTISKENFRTGGLVLRFNVNAGVVSGSITLRGHCYEQGNAVAEQTTNFRENIPGGSDDEIATNLAKKIGVIYRDWTGKLQAGFDLLSNEGLDKLRRRLPISKTKVNWRQEIIGAASMPVGKGRK
jgi:capping protein alpha